MFSGLYWWQAKFATLCHTFHLFYFVTKGGGNNEQNRLSTERQFFVMKIDINDPIVAAVFVLLVIYGIKYFL